MSACGVPQPRYPQSCLLFYSRQSCECIHLWQMIFDDGPLFTWWWWCWLFLPSTFRWPQSTTNERANKMEHDKCGGININRAVRLLPYNKGIFRAGFRLCRSHFFLHILLCLMANIISFFSHCHYVNCHSNEHDTQTHSFPFSVS